MEINKLVLNGETYNITDEAAQRVINIISGAVKGMQEDISDLAAEQKQLREDINNNSLYWNDVGE